MDIERPYVVVASGLGERTFHITVSRMRKATLESTPELVCVSIHGDPDELLDVVVGPTDQFRDPSQEDQGENGEVLFHVAASDIEQLRGFFQKLGSDWVKPKDGDEAIVEIADYLVNQVRLHESQLRLRRRREAAPSN